MDFSITNISASLTMFAFNTGNYWYGEVKTRLPPAINWSTLLSDVRLFVSSKTKFTEFFILHIFAFLYKLKQDYPEQLTEAHYWTLPYFLEYLSVFSWVFYVCNYRQSRRLHSSLLNTRRKITEHSTSLRLKKLRDVSESAAMARSILHKNVRELGASAKKSSQHNKTIKSSHVSTTTNNLHTTSDNDKSTITDRSPSDVKKIEKSSTGIMQNNETRTVINIFMLSVYNQSLLLWDIYMLPW